MHEYGRDAADGETPLPALIRALGRFDPGPDDAARIDAIRQLEELKSAAAAVQARITARFAASQRQTQLDAGVPAERADRGIAAQVALAQRTSPFRARRYLGWAKILTGELPATFAALQAGVTTEWRAMLVARETAWLSREHRAQADRELAPRLETLGDKRVEAEAKKVGYRLDPTGYMHRIRNAEKDRRVTLRPAPDTMTRLTALLPVAQGVAAYAALCKHADTQIAAGEPRGRGQVMADTLVERLTGQPTAQDVPVEVHLVMPADTLLHPDDAGPATDPESPEPGTAAGTDPAPGSEPAHLTGYGPVPGPWARDLVLHGQAPRWLRRLFTAPGSGQLVAMEAHRRLFTEAQRRFITARDQTCRTPYCDAPIRHADHVRPADKDGATSLHNGAGLCVACNIAKQAPGWHTRPRPDGTITITTPTGHRYRSRAPDLITPPQTPIKIHVTRWVHGAAA